MRLGRLSWFPCVLLVIASLAGCSRRTDSATPLATAQVVLARQDVAVGSPVDVTYRVTVAAGATFPQDMVVFVHFLDADGELMWTDDHQPPTPPSAWTPGSTVEYTRMMFVPKFPYSGQTTVEIGLYSRSSGARLPLDGEALEPRGYRAGSFTLSPPSETYFVIFKDGWHDTESASGGLGLEWQWSRGSATLAFKNPMREATFFLQLDQPLVAAGTQHVTLTIGSAEVDAFDLPPDRRELRRLTFTPEQLGTSDTVDLTLSVDHPFVPASVPGSGSADARELGVRVFRAFLQPK